MANREKSYDVKLEIAGSTALFTRPDTGAAPVSYPVPTCSASKGIFESILRLKSVEVRPTKVEICAPIVYHRYTTNYGGPLRKLKNLKEGNSYQLIATVLVNVCYRLHAQLHDLTGGTHKTGGALSNPCHEYQDRLFKRLEGGQCHYIPCLGWKEFVPSYVGCFRETTKVQGDINLSIPSFLQSVWDKPSAGNYAPQFKAAAEIVKGCLAFAE